MASYPFELEKLEQILVECACRGTDITYSDLLLRLGLRFSRPKVQTLCRALAELDTNGAERGEPGLAVLVVRSSDRLPGDGWWDSRVHYQGEWKGEQAANYVKQKQRRVFSFWQACKRA